MNNRPGGVVVTYGNMSREAMPLPASLLIFKDVSFRGFWMARWKETVAKSPDGRRAYAQMMDDLTERIAAGSLTAQPFDAHTTQLEDLPACLSVITQSQQPFINRKQIFLFENSTE